MARRIDSYSNIRNFVPPKLLDCSTSCSDLAENGISQSTQTMETNTGTVKQTRRSQKKERHPAQHSRSQSLSLNQDEHDFLKRPKEIIMAFLEDEAEKTEGETGKGSLSSKKPKVSFVTRIVDGSTSTYLEVEPARLEAETEGVELCIDCKDSSYESDEDTSSDNGKKKTKKDRERQTGTLLTIKSNRQSEIENRYKVREVIKQRRRPSEAQETLKNKPQGKANTSTSEDQPLKDWVCVVCPEGCIPRCKQCGQVIECHSCGEQPACLKNYEHLIKKYKPKIKICKSCKTAGLTTDGEESSESQ